jgi:hypothetical protein
MAFVYNWFRKVSVENPYQAREKSHKLLKIKTLKEKQYG